MRKSRSMRFPTNPINMFAGNHIDEIVLEHFNQLLF